MSHFPDHWPTESDWSETLVTQFESDWFQELNRFVRQQRNDATVYPPAEDTFNAFRFTTLAETRVVILGQDPYHGPGQAHGICFSVSETVSKLPPSLKNIYKEMAADLECEIPQSGNLESWARQGVLLLNTVLTVRESEANSHRKKGWEKFTDAVIRSVGERELPCVFILWGKPAEKKLSIIGEQHTTIVSPHPSPLSAHRGFFGSRPFSRTNEALDSFGQKKIEWTSVSRASG
ncbi:uracil-DNA glycosylase [Mariniblastus fucicola]|uniref:Uracil-DNA glycosylase n=1 Tax=Mariniblastus fucicola TaxID=980251 RepID=A0A5B9PIZ5_9BACT|nr:uracil-DNA glycosylase [Mariniblastus fucicola]QEG24632.1 Uracil-DNA glycosylase [Mariniblastus fucicola]